MNAFNVIIDELAYKYLEAGIHGHATRLACRVSETDTQKSVSDTPNEVSNILIFFRTRGHGKDTEGTQQGTRQAVKDTFFF